MSLVTLITCTGGRPEAWALCQHYIARQSYKGPIQWIVVYDTPGTPPIISDEIKVCKNVQLEIYLGPKEWRLGINTQRYNQDLAIKYVKGDFVFVIEDDEFYKATYVETMLWFLQRYDIAGEAQSHYYNIKERCWLLMNNFTHTSLCQTAIRVSKLDLLDRATNSGQLFFDIALYEIIKNEKHNSLLFNFQGLVYGMKGLPGKVGIGGGHRDFKEQHYNKDPVFNTLREWLGVDSKPYIDLVVKRE
jgi:hypothetical protein